MSVAEQAIADSRRILEAGLLDIFFPDASGNVLAASNADFYNAFLNLVGGGEAYRNRDGSVRQNLSPRIRAAVLAAMLNPERRETVERLLDNPEGYNALINGLMQSAANLAELANKPEYDLSGELSQAMELFVETRDKGQTVDEFAAQTDMFREAPSAETMFLMRLFEENAKSSGGISGVLRQYAAECKKIDTTTQSLFGEENPTKLEKLEEAYRHYAADLSSEAGNGNLRWRDTGEPAAEEISEAQKQYEEVKSKYVRTPLWMKAPNGKRTNLTEEQWVRVRTANFKRWFDDWEMLAEAYPEHEIFDIDEAYKFARGNLQGGEFTSKDGHTATLGRSGIDKMNSGLARGKTGNNRLHALAFANVGKLFGNSELLEAEPPRDGDSNIKQYLKFYAPLYMDGRFYVVKITARELYSGNKLYSLEGLDIIEESEYRGQPRGSKENSISADYSDSVKNFVRKIREVKGNVSKVVDENGEPLAVYHGTDNTNPDYTKFTVFKHSDLRVKKYIHFFSSSRDVAGSMGSYVYDVFLNIKNPLIIDAGGNSWGAIKDHTNGRVKFSDLTDEQKKKLCRIFDCTMKELESSYRADSEIDLVQAGVIKRDERSTNEWADYARANGYDGVIFRNLRDGAGYDVMQNSSDVFAVYNSNQIKSAEDNIGTYSENPDIRWRLDEGAAELDARHAELYERYKGGDEAAYGEALELVADEARRKGYDVKVYHGTGADAFNVALADSSKSEYGEGNQAHGPGLYMAANRDTAEAYKYNAPVHEFRTIGGKTFEEIGISPKELNYPVFGLVDFLRSNGVDKAKEIINTRIESQTKRLKSAEKHLPKSKDGFDRDLAWETIKSAKREISNDRITLDVIDKILSKLKENGLSISDYEYKISEGRVFDWLHNMKSDELLDEQNPNSVEKSAVGEKYKKAWFEDILPILRREYGYDGEELDSVKRMLGFHNSAKTIARNGSTILGGNRFREIMLKHGIRGITYDGRQDGRVFVSFEGEATVKLQDPFTFDDEGNLIPLSERFDEANPDMRWKIDDEVLERIKSLSSADIEGIMDEAERVVADNLKESKGRSAARVEADREKYIRDNMSEWKDNPDAFDEEDYAKGYRNYWNRRGYDIVYTPEDGWYSVVDENGDSLKDFRTLEDAKRYALERRWEDDVYDELDYKEDLYEDNPQNAMRKQFEYALRKIGIEIVNSTGGTFNGSEYIYLELPNGEEKKIRFADHPQVYSADMSVEEDWRAAFKFFVERVQREDWTEENYPDNIRWKIDDPSPERVEKLRADKWAENPKNVEMAAKKYLSRFGEGQIIVDPDEIRKLVPNYDVSDISAFVAAGDEILEVVWAAALKRTPKDKPVVLLTGNPATGKGTAKNGGFLDWVDEANLVFDAPQNKFTSVEKRVRETIDAGHRVRIIQVYNDPITSWKNSLKRGIGKDAPKTGKRDGGRFLPMAYFVEAYKNAQGKVEKIESILRQKYQNNLETKYIDNTENNPIVVSPDEAKAWDYSISDSQLKEIERITDENRGRIEESARLRGDKKDPLAIIGRRISQSLAIPIRGSSKGISRRNEQGVDGTEQSLSRQGGERGSSVSRLKSLFRQDRRENPVIWASIVLAKQILLGRAITSARLDRVLPPERFDGTKREYAVNRAREIAERYRADKEKFGNDLNLGVQRAENDLYWTRDVVEEMYASFRRDGEEYGIARQRLMEWLKEQRRRDLETVKGLSSEELGIDVPAAIEDALEKEPERRKPGENAAEESGEETFEASGEGIDAEIESAREKPAPSSIRDIIGKIRAGVTKAAKARGMDEAARRRAYRNTLAEVLRESAKRLTYGREREAIMKKISDLSAKGYSVIKIKDGERAGQKIDNYTLRAEHIALRIFNRGVRDTKKELTEKFEKIVSRKGKKPSRMERDDKRALAGAVQMRVYNIKRYSEMDAAELEAEYSATVDRLENVEKNFAERIRHYGAFAKAISKEIRKRAAIVQYGLPPFPASDTIQYRPLCGQSKRRKREQKSSNPKMRCITCESDKTLARLISIKLDLSLYASAPDSYCHSSLAA